MNDTPIILNASVSMERGNGGLDVDLTSMQSTSRHWLRIEELRVSIWPESPAVAGLSNLGNADTDLGFLVDVAIGCGNEDLTTGFIGTATNPTGERIAYVPAFLLGPRVYRRFSTINSNNLVATVPGPIPTQRQFPDQNAYVWTLPRPMLMPPGTPVKFKVRRTSTVPWLDYALLYPGSLRVEVAAVGSRLAKKPSATMRCLPHLHGWSPRNVTANRVESGEAFRNLHRESLNLTRLVGGVAKLGTISLAPVDFDQFGQPVLDPTQLQIYDGNGQDILAPLPVIPTSSPPVPNVAMTSIFFNKMNSIRVGDKLLPNQTYRTIVGPVVNPPSNDLPYGPFNLTLPMVGLESFREVSL